MREEKAWLLQSRINPFPVSGALALEDGRLSFTLDAMAADAFVGWIEKELGADEIKEKVAAGERVVAFDLPAEGLRVKWPKQFGGGGMQIEGPTRKWLVALDYPSGGAVWQIMNLITARPKAKQWKAALAEAGARS